jgi:hypothetical protein
VIVNRTIQVSSRLVVASGLSRFERGMARLTAYPHPDRKVSVVWRECLRNGGVNAPSMAW